MNKKEQEKQRVLKIKSIFKDKKLVDKILKLSDKLQKEMKKLDLEEDDEIENYFILCLVLADLIHNDITGKGLNELLPSVYRVYGNTTDSSIGYI